MVNLTRIYTGTGDDGTTRLANNQSVPKTDVRLEASGSLDEANCAIGVALTQPDLDPRVAQVLAVVQNDLFDIGADLATPLDPDDPSRTPRVTQAWVDRLETWCDEFSAGLPPLRSFVLPGGTPAAAHLHLARAMLRRAERAAWKVAQSEAVNPCTMTYLNRASDLAFILSRHANAPHREVLWTPGLSDEGV